MVRTSLITQKLQVYVNKCLRRMLREIDLEIKIHKYSYTLRNSANDISRKSLKYNPQESRITERQFQVELQAAGLT